MDWNLFTKLLFPEYPKLPNTREARFDELLTEGLTMGTLYIGRQGTGKTSSLARHLVDCFKTYPDRAMFVLDWSGSITDSIFSLITKEPQAESLCRRIIYDELGNPDLVIPMPEFSHLYGSRYEDQAQRVSTNLMKLAPELVKGAPFVAGLGLSEIAPQLFRVLTAISNDRLETWQVTEAKRLINDKGLLRRSINKYGHKVPEAKWFLEHIFLELKDGERELRTYALLALLGAIEPPETRARIGSYRPGWTPREAIKNGMLVIVNGARLINQRATQHYLFTQVYSLIMAEINKRTPGNPLDKPVALVMDEVYSLLSIPGMAEEVGMLAPLYRSRKLELYIVLQALSQLALVLKEQIWSMGNIVCFGISNFDEAYQLAQQIFAYNPSNVKMSAKTDTGQPIMEPDRGQYLQIANEIQRFAHRECIIRRYSSERLLDKYVLWVKKTKEIKDSRSYISVYEMKERLPRERGVKVSEALKEINQRNMKVEKVSVPQI